jgi:hypothetical protein
VTRASGLLRSLDSPKCPSSFTLDVTVQWLGADLETRQPGARSSALEFIAYYFEFFIGTILEAEVLQHL